ncbi:MAG: ATP-binding protein [Acidimicrobiia bacterium]|nr:ATP-binding protein [Acidimicrobiia bacterium]
MSTQSAAEAATADGEQVRRLERRLARVQRENEILETMIEEKTRSLYLAQERLRKGKLFLENILESMQAALLITDHDGLITLAGGATSALTGRDDAELVGRPISVILPSNRSDSIVEEELMAEGGAAIPVLVTRSELSDDQGNVTGTVYVATDISDRKRLEVELRNAQRLESIGQLAAGVAHELNTPIQFVGDSVRFLGDVMQDLMELLESYEDVRQFAMGIDGGADIVQRLDAKEDEIDLEFVRAEAPKAVTRTLDGLDRVATIVKALKQFSHPGTDDMAPADLNEIVLNTLTVAKNEYKYVAEIEFDAGDLGDVVCNRGDIGQVLINLVVNAAHAIGDQVEATGRRGRISIRTVDDDTGAAIEIADTGGGIPPEVQNRVFEPFFTTKEVGAGSGQGLALAHNLIVKKHQGRLWFDVEDGIGTTFHVWLPRQSPEPS